MRARVLAEADPDEIAAVNDRFNGYVGKRLQVTKAQEAENARRQALLGLRDRAVREGDKDAALEYTTATTEAEQESSHQAAWSEALDVYRALDADPLTKPIVAGLAGRDYGALAGGNGSVAALLYKADLARGVIDHLPKWREEMTAEIRKDLERKLRPAIEREVRARLNGEEPPPDTGTGGAPEGQHRYTRDEIRRMTPEQFTRHEREIERQLAGRRRGAA